ncbi:hypothetical protein [Aeromicrobium sp. CF3.5]|uniref:hypothetical protein n=1 Tax=Aeromicrobium sp. CF3.5 TaxID=3373078 RepID=UPI003EE751F4
MSAGRVLDVVATTFALIILVLESVAAFILTGFFVMATDTCGPGECSTARISLGSGLVYLAIIGAFVLSGVGIARAVSRVSVMVIWPVLGCLLVAGAVFVGGSIADSTSP